MNYSRFAPRLAKRIIGFTGGGEVLFLLRVPRVMLQVARSRRLPFGLLVSDLVETTDLVLTTDAINRTGVYARIRARGIP